VQDGVTALFEAAQEGHLECLKELLGRGASVDQADKVRCACFALHKQGVPEEGALHKQGVPEEGVPEEGVPEEGRRGCWMARGDGVRVWP
jgi:hypothetical protein